MWYYLKKKNEYPKKSLLSLIHTSSKFCYINLYVSVFKYIYKNSLHYITLLHNVCILGLFIALVIIYAFLKDNI